ncbi:Serine rich protein [Yersinia aldovae]|uniref:Serine rich protein n=1 Tax=Yersinia aldovae TaxID=29483 RepID=A0A0T9UPH9_YERAL|nr:hypothetical protein [Yersinia aldovae]CNL58298.1 Serine rich protein [Yersinia aldovae]
MIAQPTLQRSQSCMPRIGLGKSSAPNQNTVARNLSGISVTNSQLCPVSFEEGGVSGRVFYFESNSVNGQPLRDVNSAIHIETFFNSLQEKGVKIDNLDEFTKVMNQGGDSGLKKSTLKYGTKVALTLFNALPTGKQNDALMDKAQSFYNAMDKLSQKPDSTANKNLAYNALKIFTSDIYNEMGFSEKTGQEANLEKFCSDYLDRSVYSDVIAKLASVLSPERLEELKNNPEKVVEHLYVDQNRSNDSIIKELKKEFFGHKNTGDQMVVMSSLIQALEQKTQMIAGLITNAEAQETSPPAELAADNDIGQSHPVDGNKAASPGPAASNITNITNNYYITYNAPPPTSNNVSTININLSGTTATTKPENGKPQSTATNQTQADMAHSSTQLFDVVDSSPMPSSEFTTGGTGKIEQVKQDASQVSDTQGLSAAKDIPVSDNVLNSEEVSGDAGDTKQMPPAKLVTGKSYNAQGTLFGMDALAPSNLHTSSDVITTSGGQVSDLAGKQRYAKENIEGKQPNVVNKFGTAFQGMMPKSPAATALRGTGKTEQEVPQVSYKADSLVPVNKPNFITTLDIQVNSDGTLQQTADGIYHTVPAMVEAESQLNKDTAKPNPATTAASDATKIQQNVPPVSYKVDLNVPAKKTNFITTLDIELNSNTTANHADGINPVVSATKVTADKRVNPWGAELSTNKPAPSKLYTSSDVITTSGGQTRDLAGKKRYQLGDSSQKNVSSVNAFGNQFVGVGKNTPIPELTQSWSNNKGANVVLTQEGAGTRGLTEKDRYRAGKFTNSSSPNNPQEAK